MLLDIKKKKKKVEDPLNCTVVKATKHLLKRASDPPKEKKRLGTFLSEDRSGSGDLLWAPVGPACFSMVLLFNEKVKKAMQTGAPGGNC